jgi:hypothetical protein
MPIKLVLLVFCKNAVRTLAPLMRFSGYSLLLSRLATQYIGAEPVVELTTQRKS